jgi:hypothetical protein
MKQMGKIRRLWELLREHAFIAAGLAAGIGLLIYRLGSIPVAGTLSHPEATFSALSGDAHRLINFGLYLPLTLLQHLSERFLPLHSIISLRLASVIFASLAMGSMLYVIRRWYGTRILIFSLPIVITSAAILHVGRLATTDVLYLVAMPLLLATHVAFNNKPESKLVILGWVATLVLLLYIPGLVWLVILQIFWQRDAITEALTSLGSWFWKIVALGIAALSLGPLVYGFMKNLNYEYLLTWLGLPTEVPSYITVGKNAAASALFIF